MQRFKLTITFTLEPRDLNAFGAYHRKNDPGYKRAFYFSTFIIFLLCGSRFLKYVDDFPYFLLLTVTYFLLWLQVLKIVLIFLQKIVSWKSMSKDKQAGILCEHKITLTNEALLEYTNTNESKFSWAGVYRVVEWSNYLFIYTNISTAHIIPKRAFRNEEEFQEFYKFAQLRYSSVPKAA